MPITKVTPNVFNTSISSTNTPNSIVVRDANGDFASNKATFSSIKFANGSEQDSASTIAYVKINPVRTIITGTYVSSGGTITCTTINPHPFGLSQNIAYLDFTTGTAVDGWKLITPDIILSNVFTAPDITTTAKSGNFQFAIINGTYGSSLNGILGITSHPSANGIYCVNLDFVPNSIGGMPIVNVVGAGTTYLVPIWTQSDNLLSPNNTIFRVVNFASTLTNPFQFTFCLKK